MDDSQNCWIVAVQPAEPTEAERAFEQWRRDNLPWSAELQDSDILIDTIRGPTGGTLRRYRVRDTRRSEPE
jgi:hypothetical protein